MIHIADIRRVRGDKFQILRGGKDEHDRKRLCLFIAGLFGGLAVIIGAVLVKGAR